jgi:hypothetical protein
MSDPEKGKPGKLANQSLVHEVIMTENTRFMVTESMDTYDDNNKSKSAKHHLQISIFLELPHNHLVTVKMSFC